MQMASSEDPLLGQLIGGGRYRLDALIGAGGMGRVYRGEQLSMQRSVAIKLLHQHLGQASTHLERFKLEAKAASQLNHQHTVMIHDYGEHDDGALYLVMELLQGESLSACLRREGRLGLGRALRLFEQLTMALVAIHEAGLVHRDLKPENLQLEQRDGQGDFLKVLDFGIVKNLAQDENLTLDGMIFGTPKYMSPEQIRGKKEYIDLLCDFDQMNVLK